MCVEASVRPSISQAGTDGQSSAGVQLPECKTSYRRFVILVARILGAGLALSLHQRPELHVLHDTLDILRDALADRVAGAPGFETELPQPAVEVKPCLTGSPITLAWWQEPVLVELESPLSASAEVAATPACPVVKCGS